MGLTGRFALPLDPPPDVGGQRFCVEAPISTRARAAVVHQDFAGELREAAAGDAHAQKAADKSSIEGGVVFKRVYDGADFLLGFRGGDAADAIEVTPKKSRQQATNDKCHGFHFGMHGIPKNAFLEVFVRVCEPGAKGGFEVVRCVHRLRLLHTAIYQLN
jgi:hypothetical protein